MEYLARLLREKITGPVRTAEPLSRHTSFRVGGPAALFVEPQSLAELVMVLSLCREQAISCFILGGGTNLLVSDRGVNGVVVRLGGEFKTFFYAGLTVDCGAGVPLPTLALDVCGKGWSNLEFAVGIPGTLGGALVMNAGAHGQSIGQFVEEAVVLDRDLRLHSLVGQQLCFSYRESHLEPGTVVCRVKIQLAPRHHEEIRQKCEEALLFRRKRQPRQPSAGSVFKNPPGQAAGRLLEDAGLKGLRVGGAMFSTVHANFIVNCGGATAADIISLIGQARTAVREKYGVDLSLEIKLLGE